MAVRIAVVVGTTRQGRFADRPATWVSDRLAARQDVEIDVIDIRDYLLPAYDLPVSPARTPREYPTEQVAELAGRIDRADGFVILTGEYNHGYTGALKNAMDHTFVEWHRKPVTFVAWGSVGGARVVEQLRTVAVEFELAPLRHAVHILPDVLIRGIQHPELAATELLNGLDQRLDQALDDLLWWSHALADARAVAA